jgi:hypothetical protein
MGKSFVDSRKQKLKERREAEYGSYRLKLQFVMPMVDECDMTL